MNRTAHWEHVYAGKASDEVSWCESEPHVSLRLLDQIGLSAAT